MSVGLDFLNTVVNVSWGGGAFIVKAQHGEHWVSSNGKAEEWKYLGRPPDNNTFDTGGCGLSYAVVTTGSETTEGVFVSSAIGFDADNQWGTILASSNGTGWQVVFKTPNVVNDGDYRSPSDVKPSGIVWDDQTETFYAAFIEMTTSIADFERTDVIGEVIYSSNDGRSWSQVINDVSHDPELWGDGPSLMKSHFVKPENDGKFPDGLRGYDKGSDRLIYPTGLISYTEGGPRYNDANPISSVTIKSADGTKTSPVSMPCYAVAFRGGIWIAAGGYLSLETLIWSTKVDVSTDGGDSWTNVLDHTVGPGDAEAGQATAAIGGKPPVQ